MKKPKNPETNIKLSMSIKILKNSGVLYINRKVLKSVINETILENVDSNYYHLNPQTWYISMNFF